ncbi:MAG TPA: hypothetical protein VNJ47_09895 [Nevskiales bacterium]|nr:hypothetical protein [Nevskiales bacterium]
MTTAMPRHAAALMVLALSAGCAAPNGTKPGRVGLGDPYTVDPQIAWSRFRRGNIETWTADGPALQALYFIKGIRKGAPLEAAARDQRQRPLFSPEMTPHEIMEFTLDSLAHAGYTQLQAHNLRPADFGRLPGFRFEPDFLYRDGLEGRGSLRAQ